MNRRTFLQTIGAGLFAVAAPELLLPTRTIIDMMPRYSELWAQDGDDLSDLMRYLALGGTLYVDRVHVNASRELHFGRDHRICMRNSRLDFHQDIGVHLHEIHRSGKWHVLIGNHLRRVGPRGDGGIALYGPLVRRSGTS